MEEGKFGYIDYYTNLVYISPIYYSARLFSEGLAAVRLNEDSKWVFINEFGDIIANGEYDNCSEFLNGLAIVKKNHLMGVINNRGLTIIPCKFNRITRSSDGFIHAHFDNTEYLFNKNGKILFDNKKYCISDDIWKKHLNSDLGLIKVYDKESHLYGLINTKGETVLMPTYEKMESFSEGFCAVCRNVEGTSKWGFINETGQECIPCQFQGVDSFHEGIALFSVRYKDIKEYISPGGLHFSYPGGRLLHGFINTFGEIIVEADRYNLWDSKEKLIMCKKDLKYGFLNSKGEEVISCQFTKASQFEGGLSIVRNQSGKHGIIDTSGTIIIPFEYDFWDDYFNGFRWFRTDDNLFVLKKNGKFGVISIENKVIIPHDYDGIIIGGEECFIVNKDKEYGLMNHSGEFVIPMGKYYNIKRVFNSLGLELYRVFKDAESRLSGIIDNKGILRVPCEFYYINGDDLTEMDNNPVSLDSRPNCILEIRRDDYPWGNADLFCNYQFNR